MEETENDVVDGFEGLDDLLESENLIDMMDEMRDETSEEHRDEMTTKENEHGHK